MHAITTYYAGNCYTPSNETATGALSHHITSHDITAVNHTLAHTHTHTHDGCPHATQRQLQHTENTCICNAQAQPIRQRVTWLVIKPEKQKKTQTKYVMLSLTYKKLN